MKGEFKNNVVNNNGQNQTIFWTNLVLASLKKKKWDGSSNMPGDRDQWKNFLYSSCNTIFRYLLDSFQLPALGRVTPNGCFLLDLRLKSPTWLQEPPGMLCWLPQSWAWTSPNLEWNQRAGMVSLPLLRH